MNVKKEQEMYFVLACLAGYVALMSLINWIEFGV